MVEMALQLPQAKQVVELDRQRKTRMVGNLLAALCGQQKAHPVIDAGSIHQRSCVAGSRTTDAG